MKVAIIKNNEIDYCRNAPFHPQERYPEYPFDETGVKNTGYGQVRELFHLLGMDSAHYGTDLWNPLGEVIKPGQNVFIKPNLVRDFNKVGGVECMITHGSVIRAVLDYAYIALQGKGHITIGDSSYMDADFDHILRITGIDEIARFYKDKGCVSLDIVDMRQYRGHIGLTGSLDKQKLRGDPLGYSIVDLGQDSDHYGIIGDYKKFRNGYYDKNEMAEHHNREKNEYCIANSILRADVILNVPKLKTHSKAGMTCALKSLIGINGLKDWLPHHRSGSAEAGGDDYIRKDIRKDWMSRLRDKQVVTGNPLRLLPFRSVSALLFFSKRLMPLKDDIDDGGWYGNDTISRTVSDLNKIVYFADRNGKMQRDIQRKQFFIVDGIVAGECEGPLIPMPKCAGLLAAGDNPVAIDLVCSRVMGFDYHRMPVFRHTMNSQKYPLFSGKPDDIEILSDHCKKFDEVYDTYNANFRPAKGWAGHIEYGMLSPEPPTQDDHNPMLITSQMRH